MNNELDPATPPATQPARSRAAALLNTATLPATTALLAATEPKLPRLVGD